MRSRSVVVLFALLPALAQGCGGPGPPAAVPTQVLASGPGASGPQPTVTPTPQGPDSGPPVLQAPGWEGVTASVICLDTQLSFTDPVIERAVVRGVEGTLGLLGSGVVPAGEPCDATLAIELTGTALDALYLSGGRCYSGWEIDGAVTLRGEGRPGVTSEIGWREAPPGSVTACPRTPRDSDLCLAAAGQIFLRVVQLWDSSAPTPDPTNGALPVRPAPDATARPVVGGRLSDQAFASWCSDLAGPATEFGDGTHVVGVDVQPGTYRSPGGDQCSWWRLRGLSGDLYAEAIASGQDDAWVVVSVDAADRGFRSDGCGTWSADLSRVTESDTTFGRGMFIVGTDIAPGTYGSSAGPCGWQRLRGFGGTFDDIIAHYGPDETGPALVTILPSDRGFQSWEGCGGWTRRP